MMTLASLAALLRRLLDLGAEASVMEEGLQLTCGGLGLASYGIPVAPVWLPEFAVRQRLETPRQQDPESF
ncbi:hypothetical protein [Solimonas sp. SE-A11]|uniref:hypothetical protein n=1 Tax=Solimonas sp. SE-A11 TaxID=3054954 RepID=UPI00259D2953|nr:hypothetical protein [Solimonas sp. SE-A11]MDM4770187.1 hypothetical protein [Solimonas sp. SE-A11]